MALLGHERIARPARLVPQASQSGDKRLLSDSPDPYPENPGVLCFDMKIAPSAWSDKTTAPSAESDKKAAPTVGSDEKAAPSDMN